MAEAEAEDPFFNAVLLLGAVGDDRPKRLESIIGDIDLIAATVMPWTEFENAALVLLRRRLISFRGKGLVRTLEGFEILARDEAYPETMQRIREAPEVDMVDWLPIRQKDYDGARARYRWGFGAKPFIAFWLFLLGMLLVALLGKVVAGWIYR